ncbi:MAG: tail fiber domain-containing protein [Rhizobiaceae bacterium]
MRRTVGTALIIILFGLWFSPALAASTTSFFGSAWCGLKLLFNENDPCGEKSKIIYVNDPPLTPEPVAEKTNLPLEVQASSSPVVRVVNEYVTNEYVTNPTTILRETVKEVVVEKGGGRSSVDTSDLVGKTLFYGQTDRIYESIGDRMDAIGEEFNTELLTVTGNTTLATATLSHLVLDGTAYLSPIAAPSVTTNRLYNTGGDLYWAGSLIGGGSVGSWATDGTDVWRLSGNVGIGTSSPAAPLHVLGTDAAIFQRDTNGIASALTLFNNSATSTNQVQMLFQLNHATQGRRLYAAIAGEAEDTTGSADGALVFKTASAGSYGTEQMRITSAGNVGIGTTTPTYKLTVTGADNSAIFDVSGASSRVLTAGADATGDGYLYVRDNTGTANIQLDADSDVIFNTGGNVGIGTTSPGAKLHVSGGDVTVDNNEGYRSLNAAGGYRTLMSLGVNDDLNLGTSAGGDLRNIYLTTGTGFLNFTTGGSERFRITSSGNVGIGTTSPTTKLHVYEGDIAIDSQSNNALYFKDANVNEWHVGRYESNNSFNIVESGVAERLTILSGGNVGIGTTSPQAKLHLYTGSGDVSAILDSPTNSYLYFEDAGIAEWHLGRVDSNNRFAVVESGAGERLTILSGGNIGIGTTSPTFKLQVAGNIGPDADDSYNLGGAGRDWGCLYYNSGTLGTCASDQRLKTDIEALRFASASSSALDKLAALELKSFAFKDAPGSTYHGLIAQEVLEVAPELVTENTDGFLAVKYGDIQWLMLQAVQELYQSVLGIKDTLSDVVKRLSGHDADIAAMQARISALEAELDIERETDANQEEGGTSTPDPDTASTTATSTDESGGDDTNDSETSSASTTGNTTAASSTGSTVTDEEDQAAPAEEPAAADLTASDAEAGAGSSAEAEPANDNQPDESDNTPTPDDELEAA